MQKTGTNEDGRSAVATPDGRNQKTSSIMKTRNMSTFAYYIIVAAIINLQTS